MPSSDWMSEAEFRSSMGGGSGGRRRVHVDTSPPIDACTATAGILYSTPPAHAPGDVACPRCAGRVTSLADTCPPEFPDAPRDMPESDRLLWRARPCGCSVGAAWAGAYGAEMRRRKEGGEPRAVVDMPESERQSLLAGYASRIHAAKIAAGAAATLAAQAVAERRVEILEACVAALMPGPCQPAKVPVPFAWDEDEGAGYMPGVALPRLGGDPAPVPGMPGVALPGPGGDPAPVPGMPVAPPSGPAPMPADFHEQFARKPRKIRLIKLDD